LKSIRDDCRKLGEEGSAARSARTQSPTARLVDPTVSEKSIEKSIQNKTNLNARVDGSRWGQERTEPKSKLPLTSVDGTSRTEIRSKPQRFTDEDRTQRTEIASKAQTGTDTDGTLRTEIGSELPPLTNVDGTQRTETGSVALSLTNGNGTQSALCRGVASRLIPANNVETAARNVISGERTLTKTGERTLTDNAKENQNSRSGSAAAVAEGQTALDTHVIRSRTEMSADDIRVESAEATGNTVEVESQSVDTASLSRASHMTTGNRNTDASSNGARVVKPPMQIGKSDPSNRGVVSKRMALPVCVLGEKEKAPVV
jgi:hypothetical protein